MICMVGFLFIFVFLSLDSNECFFRRGRLQKGRIIVLGYSLNEAARDLD